jgi:effector-binding domain-containing protein
MTQQQKYKLVKKFVDFEVRDYESCNIAEVSVNGSMSSAGSYGFRPLFNYISQNNISMTAPVIQIPVKNDQWKISFVMPSGSDIKSLPISKNSEVEIKHLPQGYYACLKFSGNFSDIKLEKNLKLLKNAIARESIKEIGNENNWRSARFDPPFKPSFLKRNEIQIPINWIS